MKSFFIGIDASKGYADFVALDGCKRVVERAFQLDDTFEGHTRLYEFLVDFCKTHPEARLYAALESTGGYENNWLHALRRFQASLPLSVARLNPALVRRHAEASGQRIITDAVSAENVASFLIAHPEKVQYEQDDSLAGLRTHWTFIEQLVKQHLALLNQLGMALYSAHPELVRYFKGTVPAWLITLIVQYPTAQRLARARATTVSKIRYISIGKAAELIEAAKTSVGCANDKATEYVVKELARQVLHLDALIKNQKKALGRLLDLPEEVELLKTFGSIGEYSAIGILLEIQSVERFPTAKKLACFFGVHPKFKISGDGIGRVAMSKQGSPRLRGLLFMITMNAIQRNSAIAPLYKRLVEEKGMEKMAAIGVCMHKTLRILFGMLKHSRPFDPTVDGANQARSHGATSSPASRRTRRYQRYDHTAPVSNRAKKRRQQEHSQSDVIAVYGMSTPAAVSKNQRGGDSPSSVKEHILLT